MKTWISIVVVGAALTIAVGVTTNASQTAAGTAEEASDADSVQASPRPADAAYLEALYLFHSGFYPLAKSRFENALEQYRAAERTEAMQAECLYALALIDRGDARIPNYMNNFKAAADLFAVAAARNDKAPDHLDAATGRRPSWSERQADCYYNIGAFTGEQGQKDEALPWLTKALTLFEKYAKTEWKQGMCLYKIGVVRSSVGNEKGAIEAWREADRVYRVKSEYQYMCADGLYAVSSGFASLERYDEAYASLKQAAALFGTIEGFEQQTQKCHRILKSLEQRMSR